MTEPERKPAPKFPRLYEETLDESHEEGYAAFVAEVVEPVTLPFADRVPPTDSKLTAVGSFDPQYLVMLHGTDTDLPVGLFSDRGEAVEFAREVRDNPEAHAEKFIRCFDSFAILPPTRWLSVSIVEYAGPVPATRTQLFDLD